MKKILFAMGACAALMLASCSNKEKTATSEADNAVAEVSEALTEAIAPGLDPVIAQLQAQDSTIMVTPSGLGYKIVKQTRGIMPDPTSTVKVKYTGKHADGSVFDTSNDNAVVFPLTAVIPGFSEGIALMPVGSTYELYIPGNLGYGANGVPGVIAPNETLIFEVELVEIVD